MDKVIAVTGPNGRLGKTLVDRFGLTPIDVDICRIGKLKTAISAINPDIIINCAAYTDVDGAEAPENGLTASLVNIVGVGNLRENFNGRIIHISTDYIFDGQDGPYDENAEPNPLGWYGYTKLQGERVLLNYGFSGDTIVRTTILYGGHKSDFATFVLSNLKQGKQVCAYTELVGTPTNIYHLAKGILHLITMEKPPKILNIVGSDVVSRYEFAKELAKAFGYDEQRVIKTVYSPRQAQRPKKVGLKTELARKLNVPIYSLSDGINQLYVEKANIYGRYPIH